MVEKYGYLVRLWGIHPTQLPPPTATPEEIAPFLQSILLEAVPFVDDLPPVDSPTEKSPWKDKGTKTYSHASAPVTLYERTVTAAELHDVAAEYIVPHVDTSKLQPETWTLRRSVHEDAAKAGTAAWDEWVYHFKINHARSEMAFTPTVMRTEMKREWNCDGVRLELNGKEWVDWTLKLEESTHKMPAPLKPRTFPVLQATASVQGQRDFIVVQIAAIEEGTEESKGAGEGRDDVKGVYTSVERVREVGGGSNVAWIMGTVSDAKGVLPAWLQKMATPGQIAKDVDKFMDWIAKERHSSQ